MNLEKNYEKDFLVKAATRFYIEKFRAYALPLDIDRWSCDDLWELMSLIVHCPFEGKAIVDGHVSSVELNGYFKVREVNHEP